MPQKLVYGHSMGVTSVIETDDLKKTTTLAEYQDFTPIFELNKKLATQDDGYTGPEKWRRRVASIPIVLLQIWCREDGLNWLHVFRNWKKDPALKRWMRAKIYDSDNAHVLTAPHKRA
jgi:hypothetical protein